MLYYIILYYIIGGDELADHWPKERVRRLILYYIIGCHATLYHRHTILCPRSACAASSSTSCTAHTSSTSGGHSPSSSRQRALPSDRQGVLVTYCVDMVCL